MADDRRFDVKFPLGDYLPEPTSSKPVAEPARRPAVLTECDGAVCGGGSASVCAAAQIGVRETHRILAEHQLSREEVLHGTPFEDAVAQGKYPIDVHDPDGPGITFEHLDGRRVRIGGNGRQEHGRWDGQSADAPLRREPA